MPSNGLAPLSEVGACLFGADGMSGACAGACVP